MASIRSSTSAINRLRVPRARQVQELRETHQARCAAGPLLLAVFRGLQAGCNWWTSEGATSCSKVEFRSSSGSEARSNENRY